MNEKPPNAQTRAAMAEGRAMARSWMSEPEESMTGVEVTITNFSGVMKGDDLLLVGKCAVCRGDVARLIEGA